MARDMRGAWHPERLLFLVIIATYTSTTMEFINRQSFICDVHRGQLLDALRQTGVGVPSSIGVDFAFLRSNL